MVVSPVSKPLGESVRLASGAELVVPDSVREAFAEHRLQIRNPSLTESGCLQCQMKLVELEGFPTLDVIYDPDGHCASMTFTATDFLDSLTQPSEHFYLIDTIRGASSVMVQNLEALEAKCAKLLRQRDLHARPASGRD